jgi:hypothetical protein
MSANALGALALLGEMGVYDGLAALRGFLEGWGGSYADMELPPTRRRHLYKAVLS